MYTDSSPEGMSASPADSNGWTAGQLKKGTLSEEAYHAVEKQFNVQFPGSFIDWHRAYFFLSADCSLLRLPHSNPQQPLAEISQQLDGYIAEEIIPQKLYPFAADGNDVGVLVFDGREPKEGNEFPVRVYDHEYRGDIEGLSEIIFSSFPKLIECMTHFCQELKERKNFEIIPDFFQIDPAGAGDTGKEYWMGWVDMLQANFEEFGY